jgi:hypothetical protein
MHPNSSDYPLGRAPLAAGAGAIVRSQVLGAARRGPRIQTRPEDSDVLTFLASFERQVGAIGSRLLSGGEDVDEAVNQVVMSGDLDRAVEEMMPGIMATILAVDPSDTSRLVIAAHVPPFVDAAVSQAVLYGAWVVTATVNSDRSSAPTIMDLVGPRPLGCGPLAPLYSLPPTVADLWWAGARGAAASFALFYLVASTRRGAGEAAERIRRLSEIWRDGAWSSLRLAASRPGSNVPLTVVAARDRLDLSSIGQAYAESLLRLDRHAEGARLTPQELSDEFE